MKGIRVKKIVFIIASVLALCIFYILFGANLAQPESSIQIVSKSKTNTENRFFQNNDQNVSQLPKKELISSHTEAKTESHTKDHKIATCDKEPNFDIYSYFATKHKSEVNIFDENYFSKFLKDNAVTLESKTTEALYSLAMNSDLISSLLSLFQDFPDNKLIAYHVLVACKKQKCDEKLITNALYTDRHNGASWLAYANLIHNETSPEDTIDAFINAANAPTYTEYWSESFTLVEETLNQLGINTDYSPMLAISISSAFPLPSFQVINKICQDAQSNDIKLIDACINLGKQLEQSQSTLISAAIGIGLQRNIYEKLGDENALSFLKEKSQEFNLQLQQGAKASQLVLRNKQQALAYFEHLKNSSEVETNTYIIHQAIALSNQPHLDPCEINW